MIILQLKQNISSLTKMVQQRMYFLRQLKKFNLPQAVMVHLLHCHHQDHPHLLHYHRDLHASRTLKRSGKVVSTTPILDINCLRCSPRARG
ncbi:putative glutamate receptor 3-like [Scophthalmus maximus]|uniref:Putative glutamate receptor 3-like n=1 Tax=Scophthalmus maximus TaxID=52904 RepID=A0A2U9CAD0_SCOMX|nr:putative glutamate receptor 3-like [Scophthalmus maximus]